MVRGNDTCNTMKGDSEDMGASLPKQNPVKILDSDLIRWESECG